MAHKRDIRVIAEGIETEHRCSLLESIGCDNAQDCRVSKQPLADEFERLLETAPFSQQEALNLYGCKGWMEQAPVLCRQW